MGLKYEGTGVFRNQRTPIERLSWYEAAEYCNKLSEAERIPPSQWCYAPNAEKKYGPGMTIREGHLNLTGYRLPTEAEWEYAARAGARTARYFGRPDQLLPSYSWGQTNSLGRSAEVGRLKPNDLGLFDVLGNALEWVEDAAAFHQPGRSDDADNLAPVTVVDPTTRGMRGGSYALSPLYLRSAYRFNFRPSDQYNTHGLRVARTIR